MRGDLIESLIHVEKDAKNLEEEGRKEAQEIRRRYKEKMDEEEKELLIEARDHGARLVNKAEEEALKYKEQVEKDTDKKIEEMDGRFKQIKSRIIKKFFHNITG